MSELDNNGRSKPANTDTIQKGRVLSPVFDYRPEVTTPPAPAQPPAPTLKDSTAA